MAHFLDVNQLAEACRELGMDAEERLLISAADTVGKALATKLGIEMVDAADNAPGFGGLCVGYGPAFEGQPCPAAILEFDDCSDWHDATEKANAAGSGGHD